MNQVAILGVGQTPVREHWDISIRDLGCTGRTRCHERC